MNSNRGDGILNNSKIKRYFVISVFLMIQSCAAVSQTEISVCFEAKANMSIVKIDERNHRFFAIPKQLSEEVIVSKIKSSAECFNNSSWSNNWNVSVFSNEKYAGYKDEPRIIPYHKNDEWAKAYLGEFDGSSQTYTSFPAIKALTKSSSGR